MLVDDLSGSGEAAALGVDDLMQPMVSSLLRFAARDGGMGLRVEAGLSRLAESAGLSMLEAHRALHQLLDRKLVSLEEDVLYIPDQDALTQFLDA